MNLRHARERSCVSVSILGARLTKKQNSLLAASLVILVLSGCVSGPSTPVTPVGTALAEAVLPLRPGVFLVSDTHDLPLPVSGYQLYLLGETHGEHQTYLLALEYLKRLQAASGLRDIALELSQYYQPAVNEYVHGLRHKLPDPDYWSLYSGMELLDGIRSLNESLPENKSIHIHLVDLDFGAPLIYAHLQAIQQEIGPKANTIELPPLAGFENYSQEEMLSQVDQLEAAAGKQSPLIPQLTNLKYSIRDYFLMKGAQNWEAVANQRADISEEAIAQNIHSILKSGQAPLLVLFGAWHTQKQLGVRAIRDPSGPIVITEHPWAQRVTETGIKTFSLYVGGISGYTEFRGEQLKVNLDLTQFYFPDGDTLAALLGTRLDDNIVYIDLQSGANAAARFGHDFDPLGVIFDPEVPAGKIYDAMLLFPRVSPAGQSIR